MKTVKKGSDLSITVNNLSLSYRDVGVGSVPIIFLHGFPFDKTMWQPQLDCFKTSHRLISFDLRGFGKSNDEQSSLSINGFVDDLIQFMDVLNIDTAILCGLSMGGYIALQAMKRFPKRFKALILCDTQCIADTQEGREKRYKAMAAFEVDGVKNFNEGFVKNIFHKDSIAHKQKLVEQVRKVVFSNSKQILTQGMLALAERSETCATLKEISVPTLIICGREDIVTPLAQSESMQTSITGSILRVIDDAGHVSNLEQPEVFNKYLQDFLTTLEL